MTQVLHGGILCLFLAAFVSSQVEDGTGGCVWDTETDSNQELDPMSYDKGARNLVYLPEISEMEGCQKACCNNGDCQLAMIGTPADGTSQCFLVSCMSDGKDVCNLISSTQFQVYRKTGERKLTTRIEVVGLSGKSETNSTDQCRQPMVVGKCRASFPKFYYDVTSGSCKPFVYGGCDANDNNFDTEEECVRNCTGVTGTVLSKDSADGAETGPGTPEPVDDSEAVVGAIRGRMSGPMPLDNEVFVIPSSRKGPAVDMSKEYEKACVEGSDPGPCRASFPMYYFDQASQSCQGFTYGGCAGNRNRYASVNECLARCTGNRDHFEEHGDHKELSHWWPGFFLVFTLVAISVLLLATLILIVARRVRRQRRSSQSDKEELLTSRLPSYEHLPETESPKAEVA